MMKATCRATMVNVDAAPTVEAYLSLSVTSGSTDAFPVKINESMTFTTNGSFAGVSYITSTSTGAGPTASVRTWATR